MSTGLSFYKFQNILKSQFHAQYRLQDTAPGQKLMFKGKKREFVQILHKRNYRWVVISNISYSKNETEWSPISW